MKSRLNKPPHQLGKYSEVETTNWCGGKSVTLVELLIAICIFAVIAIGFSSIDTFSRYHVMSSDRRAKLQNDASYVLEHMAKEIGKAIGDVNQTAVSVTTIGGDPAIMAWIDYNQNGKRDSAPSDRQIAYRYRGASNYQIWYYSDYTGSPGSYDILSRKISAFSCSCSSTDNYVLAEVTTCWNPAATCGTLDNPALVMKNRIYMPAVSTN